MCGNTENEWTYSMGIIPASVKIHPSAIVETSFIGKNTTI